MAQFLAQLIFWGVFDALFTVGYMRVIDPRKGDKIYGKDIKSKGDISDD